MDTPTYLYRSTEDKLEEHFGRIAEAGDTVLHVIYKGGRDYVLVCRKAADQDPVVAALAVVVEELRALPALLAEALNASVRGGRR